MGFPMLLWTFIITAFKFRFPLSFSQLPHFINSSLPAHDRTTALQIDSYFRRELIYKRNERMARRVSALLQRNPNQTFFFAFGAGKGSLRYSLGEVWGEV